MHGHTYTPMHKHTTPGSLTYSFSLSLHVCVCVSMHVCWSGKCFCVWFVCIQYICGMCAFCQGMCMWHTCVHGCIHVLCIHMWGVWHGTAYMMNTFVCIVCGMWMCMVCVHACVHACDVDVCSEFTHVMWLCLCVVCVHTCDSLCARDRYMNTWMCTHMPMCMFIWSAGSFIAPKIHVLIILSTRIWKCHICGHIHIWAVCGPIHCVCIWIVIQKKRQSN